MSTEDRSPAPGDGSPDVALLDDRTDHEGEVDAPGVDVIDPATDERPRMVRFALAERTFLVDAALVLEVLVAEPCTRLPGSAPAIIGVTNVRGRIVAVVDPRPALHPHVVHEPPGRFLVITTPAGPVALLVDRVDDVLPVEPEGAAPTGDPGVAATAGGRPPDRSALVVATAAIGTHLLPVVDPLAVIAAVTAAPTDDPSDVPTR